VGGMSEIIDIKSVADFFAVPADKRAHCLKDFALWLDFTEEASRLFDGIEGVKIPRDTFSWIDDCQHDAIIRLRPHTREPKP